MATIAMTTVTATAYGLLAIDEDEAWYRHVVRRGSAPNLAAWRAADPSGVT